MGVCSWKTIFVWERGGKGQVRAWEIICIWESELLEEWEQTMKEYINVFTDNIGLLFLFYMSCRLNLYAPNRLSSTLQSQAEDRQSAFVVFF